MSDECPDRIVVTTASHGQEASSISGALALTGGGGDPMQSGTSNRAGQMAPEADVLAGWATANRPSTRSAYSATELACGRAGAQATYSS